MSAIPGFLLSSLTNEVHPSQICLLNLLNRLEESSTNLEDFAQIIELEPALATRLLRLSNAALYAHPTPCTSVREALGRLGTHEMVRLAALAAAEDIINCRFQAYPFRAAEFWNMAVLAALCAEALAEEANLNLMEAYTLGLLHAHGRTQLNRFLCQHPETMQLRPPRISYFDLADWEHIHLGVDFADATALLLKRWDFPERLVAPIAHQLCPEQAGEYKLEASLLRIATGLAASIAMPAENPPGTAIWASERLDYLGLDEDCLSRTAETARQRLVDIHRIMLGHG